MIIVALGQMFRTSALPQESHLEQRDVAENQYSVEGLHLIGKQEDAEHLAVHLDS